MKKRRIESVLYNILLQNKRFLKVIGNKTDRWSINFKNKRFFRWRFNAASHHYQVTKKNSLWNYKADKIIKIINISYMMMWIPIGYRQGLRQPTAHTELLVQNVSGIFYLSMKDLSACSEEFNLIIIEWQNIDIVMYLVPDSQILSFLSVIR